MELYPGHPKSTAVQKMLSHDPVVIEHASVLTETLSEELAPARNKLPYSDNVSQ